MNRKWIAIGLLGCSAIALAAAETLTVESSSVTLRAAADKYSASAGEIKKGTTLDVIEKRSGFAKVLVNGKEAWVRISDLKPRVAVGVNASGAGDTGGPAGSVADASAGKGLGPNAEQYARSKGGNPKQIDALIDRRNRLIDSGDWAKFAAEGNVGKNKGGN